MQHTASQPSASLALVLFRYFPYGGLQRDFMKILRACQAQGARVTVWTMDWQGTVPDDITVHEYRPRALSRIARMAQFEKHVSEQTGKSDCQIVIGFNRMAGLDFYFAADSCFACKAYGERGPLYRLAPRSRLYLRQEADVFGPASQTHILFISALQRERYLAYYPLPEARQTLLPPGIDPDRWATPDSPAIRASFRREFRIAENEFLILQVGSGFRVKGVDRSLAALAALPPALQRRVHFFLVGQDEPGPFRKQAKRLGIADRVHFFLGRDDIPRFLQGADLMLHPAYSESAGLTILEAIVAGLPVLTTDTCGYAGHVLSADAGLVCPSPFRQSRLNALLHNMLDSDRLSAWRAKGLHYGQEQDLYHQADTAADLILSAVKG